MAGEFHILMIENDPAEIDRTGEMLETSHFGDLRPSTSLHDALERLGDEAFDLVVFDSDVPDAMGFAGIDAIHRVAQHVPVLLLTDKRDDHALVNALTEGASDSLSKTDLRVENAAFESQSVLLGSMQFCLEREKRATALRNALASIDKQKRRRRPQGLRPTELAYRYGSLLLEAIEGPQWGSDLPEDSEGASIEAAWAELARRMAAARASDRQVLLVHCLALRYLLLSAGHNEFSCYMNGGRVLQLEMLGALAGHYATPAA